MKRLILLCIAAAAPLLGVNAESVMRYKLLKVMTDGIQSSTGNNSAIYVTINGNKCYDSDSEGFSNETGVRTSQSAPDGYHIFLGQTYWGHGEYLFSGDYSRLNVKVGNKVYVYTKTAMTPGSSSYFGQRVSTGNTPIIYDSNIPGSASDNNTYNSRQAPLTKEQYQYHYDKFAEQAKSIYETITDKIRNSDGTSDRVSNYSSGDSYYAYNGMLRNLRECQREMRNLREEAARYGLRLTKSYYETVTVRW